MFFLVLTPMAIQDFVGFAGLYETKLISECIQGAFFKNKKFVGVEFQDYFDPISLVTIALVLTAVCTHVSLQSSLLISV